MKPLAVSIERDEDGKFVAHCPALPGCWSQAETEEKARRNIQEAIEGYAKSVRMHGDPMPAELSE